MSLLTLRYTILGEVLVPVVLSLLWSIWRPEKLSFSVEGKLTVDGCGRTGTELTDEKRHFYLWDKILTNGVNSNWYRDLFQ